MTTAQHRTYFGKALPHVIVNGRVYYTWKMESAGRRGYGNADAEPPVGLEVRYRFHAPRA